MTSENVIYQGAEAKIITSKYLDSDVVLKKRIPKKYRINENDNRLISYRTKEEAKLIMESRKSGVSVPIVYDVDLKKGIITMEHVKGKRVKDILNDLSEKERKRLCIKIGESIGKLHKNDIIHGDITTSNMILKDEHIFFIDFGLGEKNSEVETKGVDLHVLMEALESTHSKYSSCFEYVFDGYKNVMEKNAKKVKDKIDDIVRRGRYR